MEIWLDIKDYEGHYQVSNFGNVFSLKRNLILKPSTAGQYKYLKVELCKNSKRKAHYLHRLVGQHFIPNPENKYSINHKDGNKFNNHVDNLEWATGTEQNLHGFKNKLKKPEHHSKLSRKEVEEIRSMSGKLKDIAKKYNVSIGLISMIKNNIVWRW